MVLSASPCAISAGHQVTGSAAPQPPVFAVRELQAHIACTHCNTLLHSQARNMAECTSIVQGKRQGKGMQVAA